MASNRSVLRVLVTGFRPWTGVTYNPSGVVARRLDGAKLSGQGYGFPHEATVRGRVLDVAWNDAKGAGGASVQSAARVLAEEAAAYQPHLIVSFGVLPDEPHKFDVEQQAMDHNGTTSGYEDVAGNLATATREHKAAKETLKLTFPWKAIRDTLNRTLPKPFSAVSEKGLGFFLCERIAYEGAWLQREHRPHSKLPTAQWIWATGFIHVPNPLFAVASSSSANVAALSASDQTKLLDHEKTIVAGAETAIRVALGHLPKDVT